MQKIVQQWASDKNPPTPIDPNIYCATRDVFSVRLESVLSKLEKQIGSLTFQSGDALLTLFPGKKIMTQHVVETIQGSLVVLKY